MYLFLNIFSQFKSCFGQNLGLVHDIFFIFLFYLFLILFLNIFLNKKFLI